VTRAADDELFWHQYRYLSEHPEEFAEALNRALEWLRLSLTSALDAFIEWLARVGEAMTP
jgi:hypothetical protein